MRIPSLAYRWPGDEELSSSRETSDMEIDTNDPEETLSITAFDRCNSGYWPPKLARQTMTHRSSDNADRIAYLYSNASIGKNDSIAEENTPVLEEVVNYSTPFQFYRNDEDDDLYDRYLEDSCSFDADDQAEEEHRLREELSLTANDPLSDEDCYIESAYDRDAIAELIATDCQELCQDLMDQCHLPHILNN